MIDGLRDGSRECWVLWSVCIEGCSDEKMIMVVMNRGILLSRYYIISVFYI